MTRPPKHAPLSERARFAFQWMEERRWSLLRSGDCGSAERMAWSETRYQLLKRLLLNQLEGMELPPVPDEDLGPTFAPVPLDSGG